MRRSKTYFEQIPVAVAKKIAAEGAAIQENGNQFSGNAVPTTEDWRELAQQVRVETDPDKMIHLVQQLIANLDEKKIGKAR